MKLSFNSNGYVKYSVEEMCKSLSQFGYEAVEIARTHPVHELAKQDREKLLKMIKSYGLEVCAVQGARSGMYRCESWLWLSHYG
jgi:sugar phosphate isomerase/epimerase